MMEKIYSVYEFGAWEFWGSLSDCRAYIAANQFKDSFFRNKIFFFIQFIFTYGDISLFNINNLPL
jgi:hypothetical protein